MTRDEMFDKFVLAERAERRTVKLPVLYTRFKKGETWHAIVAMVQQEPDRIKFHVKCKSEMISCLFDASSTHKTIADNFTCVRPEAGEFCSECAKFFV